MKKFILALLFAVPALIHASASPTPTDTITTTFTKTPTLTVTPSITLTRTITVTFSITPSVTLTVTPTITPTRTATIIAVQPVAFEPNAKKVMGINESGTPVPQANIFKSISALNVSATSAVWTPASGKKFRLTAFYVSGSVAGDYTLTDNGNTVNVFTIASANSTVAVPWLGMGWLSAISNTALTIKGPVAATTPCTASGTFIGKEE